MYTILISVVKIRVFCGPVFCCSPSKSCSEDFTMIALQFSDLLLILLKTYFLIATLLTIPAIYTFKVFILINLVFFLFCIRFNLLTFLGLTACFTSILTLNEFKLLCIPGQHHGGNEYDWDSKGSRFESHQDLFFFQTRNILFQINLSANICLL